MQPVWHWLHIAAPYILAALPSVITALTPYPKADGVVKVIQTILNLASVLTHKDSPGTLKAPLTMSHAPNGVSK